MDAAVKRVPRAGLPAALALAGFAAVFAADGGKVGAVWSAAAAALLAAGAFAARRPGAAESLAAHPLAPGFGAFLSIGGAAALLSGGCFWPKAWSIAQFAAAAAFGLAAWLTWEDRHRALFRAFVIGAAAVQAALTLGAGMGGRPSALLISGNPQYMGLWTAVAALLCLGMAASPGRTRAARAAAGALALVLAGALWPLSTRAGLAAFAAGGLFLLWRLKGRRAALIGALVLCAAAASSGAVRDRLAKSHDPLAWRRTHIWLAALEGIAEKPLGGWGPGGFEALYLRHRRPQEDRPARFEFTTAWAHNDYLQAAAEWGVPAAVFLVWGIGYLFYRHRPREPEAAAAQAAFAAAAVFSAFNFPMAVPANGLLAAGLAGGWGPARPAPDGGGPRARALPALLLLFAAFGAAGAAGGTRMPWNDRALVEEADRRLHGSPSDPDGAEESLRRAAELCGGRAGTWHALGHLALEHRAPPRAREAAEALLKASELNPMDAVWRLELSRALEAEGNLEGAFRAAQQALFLEPRYAEASFRLGRLMRLRGRPAAAERWLVRLLERRPGVSDGAADPALSAHARRILALDEEAVRREVELARRARQRAAN
jgi:hypothetical protein